MRHWFAKIVLLVATLAGCRRSASAPSLLRDVVARNHHFAAAEVDLQKMELHLLWKRPDGSKIGTFDAVNRVVSDSNQELLFATNAGIFDQTFKLVGLHAENGRDWSLSISTTVLETSF